MLLATLTNLKRVRNALISITEKLIGDDLSTIKVNGVDVPSVLRDITGGNIPEYPFITIANSSSSGIQGTKVLDQYVDEEDKLQIVTEQYITFIIKSYGESSESLLNDLKVKINFGYTRWIMEEQAQATFMEFSDISYTPLYLSERFIESSQMTARLSIRTIYSPKEDLNMNGVLLLGTVSNEDVSKETGINIDINYNE